MHRGEPSVPWRNLISWGFTSSAERGTYLQGDSEQERNPSFPWHRGTLGCCPMAVCRKYKNPSTVHDHYPLPNYHLSQSHALGALREMKRWCQAPQALKEAPKQHNIGVTNLCALYQAPSLFCHLFSVEQQVEGFLGWQRATTTWWLGEQESSTTISASVHWVRELCGACNLFCFFQHKAAKQV